MSLISSLQNKKCRYCLAKREKRLKNTKHTLQVCYCRIENINNTKYKIQNSQCKYGIVACDLATLLISAPLLLKLEPKRALRLILMMTTIMMMTAMMWMTAMMIATMMIMVMIIMILAPLLLKLEPTRALRRIKMVVIMNINAE